MNKNYDIKVCDFGWSTVRDKHEKMRTFCGTYEYMAPEILLKQSYNYTIDIWALGILLYELNHGYSPFRAKKTKEIYHNIMEVGIKFQKTCSDQLKDLIQKILQVNPADRISLEDILQHPWVTKHKELYDYERNVQKEEIKLKRAKQNKENL